jgi:hypothetical protein
MCRRERDYRAQAREKKRKDREEGPDGGSDQRREQPDEGNFQGSGKRNRYYDARSDTYVKGSATTTTH